MKKATGLPAATSFKHVSPAGAAVGLPLSDTLAKIYWVDDMGRVYHRWQVLTQEQEVQTGCPPFGDFISLSDVCDVAYSKD